MAEAPWDAILSDEDREVIEVSGHGGPRGLGARPALLVVDVQRHFLGLDAPTVESARVYPTSVGARGWRALERMRALLDAARARDVPVFFTQSRTLPAERRYDSFLKKKRPGARSRLEALPDEAFEIADEIAPLPGETVIRKCYASAFFATPLASFLTGGGVDTVIVCGLTTSGCVRATIVDAVSHNFNAAVVADACADRIQVSHQVGLLDMYMKYADVLTSDEAVAALSRGAR